MERGGNGQHQHFERERCEEERCYCTCNGSKPSSSASAIGCCSKNRLPMAHWAAMCFDADSSDTEKQWGESKTLKPESHGNSQFHNYPFFFTSGKEKRFMPC